MLLRSFTALLLASTLLAGCSNSRLDPLIEARSDDVQGKLEVSKEPGAATRSTDSLVVSDSLWAGDRAQRMNAGEPLPSQWLKADAIAIRSDSPLELNQIVSVLTAQTRIPIRLTGGAEQVDATMRQAMGGGSGSGGGSSSSGSSGGQTGMILAYEGPLPGLLDLIAGYYNVNWQYAAGTITINRFRTRTFVIDALPGSISVAAPGSSGATSGAAATATATPLSSANIDIWEDIRRTLESIIDTQGTVTISQSSGTIVVSTTSDRMEQVSTYIAEENARLSRQVAITIDLYSVDVSDASAYGFDLTAALSSIANLPTVSISGPTNGITAVGAGSMTVTLVEPSELAGTQGVVRALATLGKTSRVAQIPLTTLNNRPANQRIAVDTAYVSEASTTTTGTAGTTTSSASTSTVTTGITVSVLPRIMSDGRILLQYALAQGELLRLVDFPVGTDQTVQLPETQGISFSQQVMMRNGSTLLLAGYDQSDASTSGRGVGRPLTWAFGGNTQSTQARKMVVIAITPREISVARREAS